MLVLIPIIGTCTLTWNSVPDLDVVGYRLYATLPGHWHGELMDEVHLEDLDDSTAPQWEALCARGESWVVTAFDFAGNESAPSNEAEVMRMPDPHRYGYMWECRGVGQWRRCVLVPPGEPVETCRGRVCLTVPGS